MAKQMMYIQNQTLESILKDKDTDRIFYEKDKIIIDGKFVFAKEPYFYNGKPVSGKATASGLIKKEPEFDYNFCEEIYEVLDKHGVDGIRYASPRNECTNLNIYKNTKDKSFGSSYHYMLDLYSAFPHVLKYERLPISGNFYRQEDPSLMNFYLYKESGIHALRKDCIITDELKNMIGTTIDGEYEYLFSTDWKRGSKMGDTLHAKAYKNKKTKKELKDIHYGYYQKPYLKYEGDCYVRQPKFTHELLMVAIKSQLTRIILEFWLAIGDMSCFNFVTDAVYFNKLPADFSRIDDYMASKCLSGYAYRIYDCEQSDETDDHGTALYKTYPDLPEPPRSHHKKN